MGDYWGVFEEDRLIAMTGERRVSLWPNLMGSLAFYRVSRPGGAAGVQ